MSRQHTVAPGIATRWLRSTPRHRPGSDPISGRSQHLRPVATSLLLLLVALFGVAGYNLMPLAALPQVELPTIGISAELPGASAEVMATSVATPLERQLALISGISAKGGRTPVPCRRR